MSNTILVYKDASGSGIGVIVGETADKLQTIYRKAVITSVRTPFVAYNLLLPARPYFPKTSQTQSGQTDFKNTKTFKRCNKNHALCWLGLKI
jgi:hypothetical protein